jgi:DNA-directed RNA polymerase subunit alpha
MTKTQNLFFSCVESRIQDHGSLYGRFHIGTFFRGQALTFANALRRTLLSEIPGVRIKDISIEGVTHEFALLPGVEESVLDILFNLKSVVFAPCPSKSLLKTDSFWKDLDIVYEPAILRGRGPIKLTAGDIKLPVTVKCVNPETPIATLTGDSEFLMQFCLSLSQSYFSSTSIKNSHTQQNKHILNFESVPMPIQKVNYGIKSLNAKQGSEYIVFEVWTDGSLLPQEAVDFGLKQLTHLFYQFASFENKTVSQRFLAKT